MSDLWVFGYGSLVHPGTHDFTEHHRVRVHGWQRAWRHRVDRPGRACVSLTVIPGNGWISGLLMRVPKAAQAALDRREGGYDRIPLRADQIEGPVPDGAVIYVSRTPQRGGADFPILQSYLDVCLAGYHALAGAAGMDAFLRSTADWDIPIKPDRKAPAYPRAQQVGDRMAADFDAMLAAHGLTWLPD